MSKTPLQAEISQGGCNFLRGRKHLWHCWWCVYSAAAASTPSPRQHTNKHRWQTNTQTDGGHHHCI